MACFQDNTKTRNRTRVPWSKAKCAVDQTIVSLYWRGRMCRNALPLFSESGWDLIPGVREIILLIPLSPDTRGRWFDVCVSAVRMVYRRPSCLDERTSMDLPPGKCSWSTPIPMSSGLLQMPKIHVLWGYCSQNISEINVPSPINLCTHPSPNLPCKIWSKTSLRSNFANYFVFYYSNHQHKTWESREPGFKHYPTKIRCFISNLTSKYAPVTLYMRMLHCICACYTVYAHVTLYMRMLHCICACYTVYAHVTLTVHQASWYTEFPHLS